MQKKEFHKYSVYTYETGGKVIIDSKNKVVRTMLIYKFPVGSDVTNEQLKKNFTFSHYIG